MGYETRIYLCERLTFPRAPLMEDYLKIAMIDLSKAGDGEVAKVFKQGRERSKAWIKKGGNAPYAEWRLCRECEREDPIIEDMYGDPLGANTAEEVLLALKHDNEKDRYRRFDIAIAMIEAAMGKFRDLHILSFGH